MYCLLAKDGPRHLEIHRGQTRWTLVGLAGQEKAKATKARKAKEKAKRARVTRARRTEKERTDQKAGAKADKNEKKCFWCGRKGHMQADCYFKKEYEKKKGGVNMVNDINGDGDTTAVDWVLAIVGERAERPFIDSGAVCSTFPPSFALLAALENVTGERPLRAANGHDLDNFGSKVVKQEVKLASGKSTQVSQSVVQRTCRDPSSA